MANSEFEKVWDEYWWKKRTFSYRCSHNEQREREIIATALEALILTKKAL